MVMVMKERKLPGSPIVYYVSGTERKEWALFLHAAFVDHNMFNAQAAYFREKYNVLTLDVIGHGKSTDAKKGDGIDKMSLWIYEILQAEKIGKIHLVGISLGAVLAQDFANRYPEKISSLACFGGYDINHMDENLQKENRGAQARMMFKAMVSVKWFAESNKKISAYTSQAQKDFYEMNLKFPKKSIKYLASLGRMIDDQPPASKDYPLLIGCGKHDIPAELSAVEQWRKNEAERKVVKTIVFQGAGHCVNMDTPQEFNKALEEFWSGRLKEE